MTNKEAVNWLINVTADIGKIEHQDLWHYEQALSEIREMLEDDVRENRPGQWIQTETAHMEGTVSIAPRWGCSCCGREFLFDPVKAHFLYCPECGAENMMEEDDEKKNDEQKN